MYGARELVCAIETRVLEQHGFRHSTSSCYVHTHMHMHSFAHTDICTEPCTAKYHFAYWRWDNYHHHHHYYYYYGSKDPEG